MVHTVYKRANCLDGKGGVRVDREYTYLNCLAELGVGGAHPGGFKLTQDILSAEHIGKKTTVLDAGCGTGQTAAYVAQQ